MILDIRRRYETAIRQVLKESFSDDDEHDAAFMLSLADEHLECPGCGQEHTKVVLRVYLAFVDDSGNFQEHIADMPTTLNPRHIREFIRGVIGSYRISSLEQHVEDLAGVITGDEHPGA